MGSRPLAANARRRTMGSRTLGATRAELALGGRLLGTLGFTLSNTRRAIMFKSLIVMALAAMTLAAWVSGASGLLSRAGSRRLLTSGTKRAQAGSSGSKEAALALHENDAGRRRVFNMCNETRRIERNRSRR